MSETGCDEEMIPAVLLYWGSRADCLVPWRKAECQLLGEHLPEEFTWELWVH